MKKILLLIMCLGWACITHAQDEKKLMSGLSSSLGMTKKDAGKGLYACLDALNRYNPSTVLPASASLHDQFIALPGTLSFVREANYDNIVEQLFKHFEACKKTDPAIALQFIIVIDAFTQHEMASYDEWRPRIREFLYDNGWLMLYQYYGIDYYDTDNDWDTDCSYALLNDYEWAEEGEFIKSDNEKLSLAELNMTLAEYMSTDNYYIVDDISKYKPVTYFQELKSWGEKDLLAVWYNMLEAFESGQLYKAILYGKLARNAKISGKNSKEYLQGFLQDYEMVTGTLFDPRAMADSVTMKDKMGGTRLWKMFGDITTVAEKSNKGTLTLEDINQSKKKIESLVARFDAKKYFEYGVYQYDLSYAGLYKNYGARTEALFHLQRLKQVDSLSFLQWMEHDLILSEYADFHLQMALLCYGLDNDWYERERREVEQILKLLTGITPFQKTGTDWDPRNKIDFARLKENVSLINEFVGTWNLNRQKAIADRLRSLKEENINYFTDISVLLPNQFPKTLYVENGIFFNWMAATSGRTRGPFEKYASCGYPLLYGMNNLSLFHYLDDYHDLLKERDQLYDFEPWYNFTFNLYENISYTRPLCIDQFNIDLAMMTLYDEKGYDNKVENLLARWRNHTRQFNDTLSRTYAFTLAAETEYLDHKLPGEQKVENARKYFEIVKVKGDCSQCYITSALMLAGNYLDAGDTVRAERIAKDLVQKVNTEKTIPNDLQSAIWKCKAEILRTRIQSRYKNNQPYNDLLTQLEKVMAIALPLDRTNENAFYAGQVWAEMERKNYSGLASVDKLWKFFHDEHLRYRKNSLLFTDKDRQEYFDGLLNYLDLATWRYSLLPNDHETLAKDIFSYTVHYKSFSTGSFPVIKKYVMAKNDATLTEQWNTWIKLRSNTGKRQVEDDLKEYKIEKEILSAMQHDKTMVQEEPVSFDEIRKKLDDKSYLINLVASTNDLTGEKIYFAQVVQAQSKIPQYVYLGKATELEEKAYTAYEKAMRTLAAANTDTIAYTYFWKPFEKIIPPKSKVYLLNEGIYHKVNLGSVYRAKTKQYLCDQWDFQVITHPDQVGKPSGELGAIKADIFGNPQFNLSHTRSGMIISRLQNTEQECASIEQILGSGESTATIHRYTAQEANEDKLKEIAQPTVLHIATHGFFVPDQAEEKEQDTFEGDVAFRSSTVDFANATDPLLRSGILLSGAENTLNGKNLAQMSAYHEDGILTAKEAMELNLDGTQLVVLSACETGLGEIIPGQSIAGLQNCFKTAGARYLLLTLWSVDDQATKEFMVMFYNELVKNRNKNNAVEESFFSAQRQFKQLPQYAQPFFWGAFVLVK